MTARTTKASRTNPHPARKARQLAGFTSGLAYAGATIGIGVAAAGGSDSVEVPILEGEAAAGQVVKGDTPDGLAFHLEGAATAPGASFPTTVVGRPLVLTAPTVPGESSTSTEDDEGSGLVGSTTAVATTAGGVGSNPRVTTTQAQAPATSSSDQPTTTSSATSSTLSSTSSSNTQPTTTQPTTTQPTTTETTTTQPTTTQPTTTQPPTTESGAS